MTLKLSCQREEKKINKNYSISKEEFKELGGEYNLVPVYREIIADMETPVSAFIKLREATNSFLLESVEGGETLGRYSFIGINPFMVVSCKNGKMTIEGENEEVIESVNDPLDILKSLLKKYRSAPLSDLPPFFGGAVGYIGYDYIRYVEDVPCKNSDDLDFPELHFLFTDTVVIFDHLKHRVKVLVNVRTIDDAATSYDLALVRIEEIISKLRSSVSVAPLIESTSKVDRFDVNIEKSDFIDAVKKAKEYIFAGDILQTVISQRFSMPITADPFDIYRVLRTINPSPYLGFLDFSDMTMIASSPEPLIRVEGDKVITRPIAGTRRRGQSDEEDIRLGEELLSDEKEKAEHIMLLDLGRNDLGAVCKPGTVEVDDFMFIERYSHVMHIVSQVSGEIAEDKDIFDVLRAAFPAGTVSGAPKIRAMEIIDELEPARRGPYAGVFGYFSFTGNLDTGITIRTIVVKDDTAYVQAGAGIVADSVPELEYDETVNKAMALLRAVIMAEEQKALSEKE